MKILTDDEILRIHSKLVEKYGGQDGVRDEGTFHSECAMPFQSFGDYELYPDIYDKGIRYLFGFVTNQVFLDGNKRTGVMCMLIFLKENGIGLNLTSKELSDIGYSVAKDEMDANDVKDFLLEHTV